MSELYAIHAPVLKERAGDFGHRFRTRVIPGALLRAEDYVQAMRGRALMAREMNAVFERYDVLATAGWLSPAEPADPALDFFPKRQLVTMPFSLTGHPALCMPCGFSGDGLPLSLQLAGRHFDEATLLRAAHAYEQATDWHRRKPPLPVSARTAGQHIAATQMEEQP